MLNFSKVRKIAKWLVINNKTSTWLFIFLELAQYGTEKQQNIIYTINNKKY